MTDSKPEARARQAVLVAGVRTPFLKSGGAYGEMAGFELAAAPLRHLRDRFDLAPDGVDLVTMGMVVQDVATTNVAREAMLAAGFSSRVPAYTVSMAGVSPGVGVANICDQMALGRLNIAIAAGADHFSDLPIRLSPALRRRAVRLSRARSWRERLGLLKGLRPRDLLPDMPTALDMTTGLTMGECCERMATRHAITREAADRLAVSSHQRAHAARSRGFLADDIMPLTVTGCDAITEDDTIRPQCSLAQLSALKPSFSAQGVVTAGNASGLTDGAAALLIMTAESAERAGHAPLAYLVDHVFSGVADLENGMLLGPAMAIPPMLARHGLVISDIDVFELHEAFAAQVLANQSALADPAFARLALRCSKPPGAIPENRLNAWGGSLAFGNPFGATSIRLLMTAARRLQTDGGRYAIVATCAGGGLGAAYLLERPEC